MTQIVPVQELKLSEDLYLEAECGKEAAMKMVLEVGLAAKKHNSDAAIITILALQIRDMR